MPCESGVARKTSGTVRGAMKDRDTQTTEVQKHIHLGVS